ncbi:uncharacterized protein LOC143448952 [Clavelina lepadiformis]|uniref:uncharacterized protein LOC143448952 n=1 Tax=Clavelina lepadiformis TaxID=159417 RepID=UPI004041F538
MSSDTVIDCLSDLFCLFGFPAYIHSDRGSSFMSRELKDFLMARGIATSYSTPYHPQGNSQCERANQTIWRTIKLLLSSYKTSEEHWERVLPQALHGIRSLLCTATNETPHERMFPFPRRATLGSSMPTWLLNQGTVLLRRFVRNKGDPVCDPVELMMVNPTFARVKYPNGRESTVSTSDLAPCPQANPADDDIEEATASDVTPPLRQPELRLPTDSGDGVRTETDIRNDGDQETSSVETDSQTPRRSTRERRPPQRYGEWTL